MLRINIEWGKTQIKKELNINEKIHFTRHK